jgi:hypothetical protein
MRSLFRNFSPVTQGYWLSLLVMPLYQWVYSVNYFHDASHFAL